MYTVDIEETLKKKFKLIKNKNWSLAEKISRKVKEIRNNPHRYKNLRGPLSKYKRVHVGGSFVLLFSVNEKSKTITLRDFDHHKRIYDK